MIAQLNRQPELRGNGKPRLSDLRESGSIEQDADVVGLLVRAEYYETDEEAKQEVAGEAELIIAKQRNGPIGDVPLVFLREFTRFERVFEKLTLPLRSRAHLRDYGSHEHPMLRHRSQRRRLGLDRPVPAGSPVGWAATHDRPARRP